MWKKKYLLFDILNLDMKNCPFNSCYKIIWSKTKLGKTVFIPQIFKFKMSAKNKSSDSELLVPFSDSENI